MGRLTHRDENGKAAVWLYADPERPADVVRERLKKEEAVIERLAHYEDLEEAGRLVVLPDGFEREKLINFMAISYCPSYFGFIDKDRLKGLCNGGEECKECWEAALKGGAVDG